MFSELIKINLPNISLSFQKFLKNLLPILFPFNMNTKRRESCISKQIPKANLGVKDFWTIFIGHKNLMFVYQVSKSLAVRFGR